MRPWREPPRWLPRFWGLTRNIDASAMLLLDTDVVSEIRKVRMGKADPNVAKWVAALTTESLFVSAITLHELEIGVLLAERRDPRQGAVLRLWLETQVIPVFDGKILAVDTAIGRRAAKLHVPQPRPIDDALIAATALVHGLTIVTRNVADFEATGFRGDRRSRAEPVGPSVDRPVVTAYGRPLPIRVKLPQPTPRPCPAVRLKLWRLEASVLGAASKDTRPRP
jgi:predicted nucleic acid-binding protein